jgi:tyrosine-specific transport protein
VQKKNQISLMIRGSLLIAGTAVGAGMLGIPLVTARAGFLSAFVVTLLVWIFMTLTGFLLLEVTLTLPSGANFISITRKYLGKWGGVLAAILFIFLYYFLMIAYVAAGGPLLKEMLLYSHIKLSFISGEIFFILFSTIFGVIVAIGPRSIDRVNYVLSILLGAVFLALFWVQFEAIEPSRLEESDFSKGLFAIPVLFSAFGFHNIIPSLVTYFEREKKVLRGAIFIGTTIPLLLYLLWQLLVIGSVPSEDIVKVLDSGKSVISYLADISANRNVLLLGELFAFLAIITSVLGVSFSLVDFLGDGLGIRAKGKRRVILTFLTFFPPTVAAMIRPEIFNQALGIAGGLGESLINGLIPIALYHVMEKKLFPDSYVQSMWKKAMLLLLTVSAFFVIGIEIVDLY